MTDDDRPTLFEPDRYPYSPSGGSYLQRSPIPGLPRARNTDPVESHEAAASVTNLTEKQSAVLACLKGAGAPLTDHAIGERYERLRESAGWPQQSESGLRTRRSELAAHGRVEKVGRGKLPSGRSAALWSPV